jgi:hypothetical protein
VRRLLVSTGVLLALAVLVLARDAGGAAHPALKLEGRAPVTIAGTGFAAHERVRLVLHSPRARSRQVTASSSGTFSKAFSGVAVDRCSGFWVSATGSRGSRAVLRRPPPECPPA